jgi:NAD(P)-dependent dehydrogenase (short-subunit alcohol dehydrogenase family)
MHRRGEERRVSDLGAARRVAIITGGGTGIGRGILGALAAGGFDCAIAGRRPDVLDEAVRAVASERSDLLAITADVTTEDGRAAIVAGTLERFGRLDVLVNNAGASQMAPLLGFTVQSWREVMALNLEAAFFMAQLAIPPMRRQGYGRIINIGSILGMLAPAPMVIADAEDPELGPWRSPPYFAAKGGMLSIGRDLAAATGRWGITVNTVSPGMIERPERARAPEIAAAIAENTPVGRLGTPDDVGPLVRFLASEDASFITGANIVVDGGWSIW